MGGPHVNYRKFNKTSCCPVKFKNTSHVDFKKVPFCMSLRPKKGHVAVSILGVYTHKGGVSPMCTGSNKSTIPGGCQGGMWTGGLWTTTASYGLMRWALQVRGERCVIYNTKVRYNYYIMSWIH